MAVSLAKKVVSNGYDLYSLWIVAARFHSHQMRLSSWAYQASSSPQQSQVHYDAPLPAKQAVPCTTNAP